MKQQPLLIVLMTLVFSCKIISAQIPSSGLVAYWPLNGNYTDAGPNAVHGTNFGSTTTVNKQGALNSAVDFANPTSTVSQYATHPVNTALSFGTTQNFTISFLFYLKSPWVHTGGFYDNCLNYNGPGVWIWMINGVPTLQFNFRNASIAAPNIPLGVWKHVTCVRNSGTMSIYIDGNLVSSGAVGTGTPAYSFPARFGTMFYNAMTPPNYNPLHGRMDEFRIYNRALTVAEITGLAASTLPLRMDLFTAVEKQGQVRLDWTTIQETNTSHFEIERSTDGNRFDSIGRIQAAGNSTVTTAYTFNDVQAWPGINYYRLRMIDRNGVYSYSRVITVKTGTLVYVQLFPNPVQEILQVQFPAKTATAVKIRIADMQGKLLLEKWVKIQDGNNTLLLPVHALPAGTYRLLMNTGQAQVTKSFIKL